MYEALIAALVALVIAGVERVTAWLRAREQNKVFKAVADGVEKIDNKAVKAAIDKMAEKSGVKDSLDEALEKIGLGPQGDK